jgi:hypothetical protein
LATIEAIHLPGHKELRALADLIGAQAARLAAEINVPVGSVSPANAVVRAMESSLANQGLGRVRLDADELSATLDRLTDFKREHGAFLMADLIYAIDTIGVKARRGDKRYLARSKGIPSFEALVRCLEHNQTVLAGVSLLSTWWDDPARTRQVLDLDEKASHAGGLSCIVSGFNAARREYTLHTFHPRLGRRGVITLTEEAARQLLDLKELRLVEPAPLPLPFSQKAYRDLASRLPRTRKPATRSPRRSVRRRPRA